MEWTPEAINAEIEYRRGDLVARRHLKEARQAQPRWWSRLRRHRSDGRKEAGRAA